MDMLSAAVLAYMVLGGVAAAVSGNLSIGKWFQQVLLVLDQALNVLLTPFHASAWADETMSARAWRAYRDHRMWGRVMRPVIDALFIWQRAKGGHCYRAYERERGRAHTPPEYR
jgi:hypothetical protein